METLIVNYITEKGEISFVKVPDDAVHFGISKSKKGNQYLAFSPSDVRMTDDVKLPSQGFQLIGLTNEVTEDQARMMIDHCNDIVPGLIDGYVDYRRNQLNVAFTNALASFKSLMQHLNVYEVNPYCNEDGNEFLGFGDDLHEKYKEAQERTGRWIVLFKPNEK